MLIALWINEELGATYTKINMENPTSLLSRAGKPGQRNGLVAFL